MTFVLLLTNLIGIMGNKSWLSPDYPKEASFIVWGEPSDTPNKYFVKDGKTNKIIGTYTDAGEAIQTAIVALPRGGGKIFLRAGNYNIYKLTEYEPNKYWGLAVTNVTDHFEIVIEGENPPYWQDYPDYQLSGGVSINITQEAINAVPADAWITGIGSISGESFPGRRLSLENLAINFPDNQRSKVIGISFYYFSGAKLENVFVKVNKPLAELALPAVDTYGIEGLVGSKIGPFIAINTNVQGWWKGWHINGEHFIGIGCYAIYCEYPWVIADDDYPAVYHHNLLLGCGFESCRRGLKIGNAAQEGSLVDLINFDIEYRDSGPWAQQSYAVESRPGYSGGIVTYTVIKSNVGLEYKPFWENGNGINFLTKCGYATEKSGSATFSGDGVTTSFSFPHGLVATPSHVEISFKSAAARDAAPVFWSADATDITVTFKTAPAAGTDNVLFSWKAQVY